MVNIRNISFTYKGSLNMVLDKIDFDVEKGQCVGILGNNGAGKSTLIKCIGGIHQGQTGRVYIDGKNIFEMPRNKMAKYIAYVPQNNESSDMTVFDFILLGRKPYIKWNATREDYNIVGDILDEMGLSEFTLRKISQLSGGEAQKVMIARALAQQPRFLLLDEPTSNLDPYNKHEVLEILKKVAENHNISILIVIHDLNLAMRYCDKYLFLKDGKVYSFGGIETITPKAIKDVYRMEAEIVSHKNWKVIVPN